VVGWGVWAQPLLHRLLEALHLAAGGRVAGGGVDLGDAEAAQFVLEPVAGAGTASATGEPGGEDHPVVGERGGRDAVLGYGCTELVEHDRAGDPGVGGDPQGVAGVVIEPGQDLGVGAGSAVWSGESVVGEVGLPALVGLLGGEGQER